MKAFSRPTFFPRSIFRSFTFDFVFFTYKRIGTGVGVWVAYGGGVRQATRPHIHNHSIDFAPSIPEISCNRRTSPQWGGKNKQANQTEILKKLIKIPTNYIIVERRLNNFRRLFLGCTRMKFNEIHIMFKYLSKRIQIS